MYKRRFDRILFGLIMGIVMPLIVFLLFYLSTYAYLTVPDFLRKMAVKAVLFPILSLCAIINLGVFFFFYQTQNDRAAKGVILATMMYAFVVMVYKISSGQL